MCTYVCKLLLGLRCRILEILFCTTKCSCGRNLYITILGVHDIIQCYKWFTCYKGALQYVSLIWIWVTRHGRAIKVSAIKVFYCKWFLFYWHSWYVKCSNHLGDCHTLCTIKILIQLRYMTNHDDSIGLLRSVFCLKKVNIAKTYENLVVWFQWQLVSIWCARKITVNDPGNSETI